MDLIKHVNKNIQAQEDIYGKIHYTLSGLRRLESRMLLLEHNRIDLLRQLKNKKAEKLENQILKLKRERRVLLRKLEKLAAADEILETDLARELAEIVVQQK